MPQPAPKRENILVNLICNIAIPSLILSKLSAEGRLGPVWGLIVALAFPVGYGVYDFVQRRRANFISILGFSSVLLTGGLGLLKVDGFWIAVKEGTVPLVIGVVLLASLRSKTPVIRELFYNDQVVDVAKVDAALAAGSHQAAFARLLARASYWLGGAFAVSAVLNFVLARYLLKSPPGTPEFNAELGRMNLLSWPVIVVPSTIVMMYAFWRLITGLRDLTGLTVDEIFRGGK
jgi:hypothetical protein